MPPILDKDKCIACGTCVEVCPQDVYFNSMDGDVPEVSYPEECWHCNACVLECPAEGAVRLRIPLTSMILYK